MTKAALLSRGLLLEYITLGWNVVGVAIVLAAARADGSVALAGFSLDSLIEIFASLVVVWELKNIAQRRQRHTLRLIGVAFLLLSLYIVVQSIYTLSTKLHPAPSLGGMAWLLATFMAMLLLAWGKQVTGTALDNAVLKTEGRVTLIDALLAGAILIGLVLNALLGWWWADPLASLVIVFYGIKEGWHALHGEE